MEEDKRKIPSLPPNYVTLLQLQERWIKQQKGKNVQVSEKSEVAVCGGGGESTERNVETEGLKKKVKKGWSRKRRRQREREARAQAENEVTGSETHALPTSVEKEESVKSINVVVTDPSCAIEGNFRDMSIKSGRERGSDRSVRPHNGRFHRGKNGGNRRGYCEHGSDYRRLGNGRRVEGKMVWVKKGEVSGVNDGGVQSFSCSLKESE